MEHPVCHKVGSINLRQKGKPMQLYDIKKREKQKSCTSLCRPPICSTIFFIASTERLHFRFKWAEKTGVMCKEIITQERDA
jgi:hypothetical protein